MDRAKESIRAASSTWPTVAWREVMTEDVCAWNLVLLEQPANKVSGSGGLGRGEWIVFSPDMFDADRAFVRAHAMIGTVAIAHHLINVAVPIDDVVCRDLATV